MTRQVQTLEKDKDDGEANGSGNLEVSPDILFVPGRFAQRLGVTAKVGCAIQILDLAFFDVRAAARNAVSAAT